MGPTTRSATRSCPTSPTRDNAQSRGTSPARSLPRVAGLATRRARSPKPRGVTSASGQRPPTIGGARAPLSDQDMERIREIVRAEVALTCTDTVISEMEELLPSFKYEVKAEVLQMTDALEEKLSTRMDDHARDIKNLGEGNVPTMKKIIEETISTEREYFAKKLEDIESRVYRTYAVVQKDVQDLQESTQVLDIARRSSPSGKHSSRKQVRKDASSSDDASNKGEKSRSSRRHKRPTRRRNRKRNTSGSSGSSG